MSTDPKDPRISTSGGSFDFDSEHGRSAKGRPGPEGPQGPGGPGWQVPGSGAGQGSDAGQGGPGWGGPGPGRPGRPGGGSGKPRRSGCATVIGLVVVLIVLGLIVQSCSGGGASANCGDYDLVDGQYVENPNEGDYERNGESYDYVGCDASRSGGGFFFLPFLFGGGGGGTGSNYGDGSGFRGGGPGSGK